MSKRLSKAVRLAQEARAKKRARAMQTMLPLVMVAAIFGLLFAFFILPNRPEAVLQRAVNKSVTALSGGSVRYAGTFGNKDEGWSGEFAGQNSGSSRDLQVTFMADDKRYTKVSLVDNDAKQYYKVDSAEAINNVVAKVPGFTQIDPGVLAQLAVENGKWHNISGISKDLASSCIGTLSELISASPSLPTAKEYPFDLAGGPYGGYGDSQDQVFDVTLKPSRSVSTPEKRINAIISCLEQLRVDDNRLKTITKTEADATKIRITVDPLAGTVKKVVYKYVGLYFQINFRDYGKDIVISTPQ
jgi:hypothetical protein